MKCIALRKQSQLSLHYQIAFSDNLVNPMIYVELYVLRNI